MPQRPKTICNHPGCGRLIDGNETYCAPHLRIKPTIDKQARAEADARRGSAAARGYGYKWQQARSGYLNKHPLCRICDAQGRLRIATVVDHVVAHNGDQTLFWNSSNWQPLCKACHDRKTAKHDGGFGNSQRSAK